MNNYFSIFTYVMLLILSTVQSLSIGGDGMERKGERRWEENPNIHIGVTPQQFVTKTYILAFSPYLSERNIKSKNLPYTTTSKSAYSHTHTLLNDINSDAC